MLGEQYHTEDIINDKAARMPQGPGQSYSLHGASSSLILRLERCSTAFAGSVEHGVQSHPAPGRDGIVWQPWTIGRGSGADRLASDPNGRSDWRIHPISFTRIVGNGWCAMNAIVGRHGLVIGVLGNSIV